MAAASELILHLRFPATRGYLRISRINATTLGADLGFDVDQLDDLRLAVDEAVNWLVSGAGDTGEVLMDLASTASGLTFVATLTEPASGPADVDDLVHAVLGATVDEYQIGVSDGHRRVELSKNGR